MYDFTKGFTVKSEAYNIVYSGNGTYYLVRNSTGQIIPDPWGKFNAKLQTKILNVLLTDAKWSI